MAVASEDALERSNSSWDEAVATLERQAWETGK
jgi:hypothetical protein